MAPEHDMIEFKKGDILRTNAEALLNTVNCVGIMGRGGSVRIFVCGA